MKLRKFRTSNVFVVKIVYNGETFKFNLAQELKISEHNLSNNLKNQPIDYSFLFMLHKKLLTEFERLKTQRNKIYGRLFLRGKEQLLKGRPYTEDMAKAWAEKHPDYVEISNQCITAKDNADTIYACVRGFEQRKDLLQTISSNTRKEKGM